MSDFVEAQAFIAADNPQAASGTAQRVWAAAVHLADNPLMGRNGSVAGTREWVVSSTPYLLVYRVREDTVEILRLWHGRRDWQNISTT